MQASIGLSRRAKSVSEHVSMGKGVSWTYYNEGIQLRASWGLFRLDTGLFAWVRSLGAVLGCLGGALGQVQCFLVEFVCVLKSTWGRVLGVFDVF